MAALKVRLEGSMPGKREVTREKHMTKRRTKLFFWKMITAELAEKAKRHLERERMPRKDELVFPQCQICFVAIQNAGITTAAYDPKLPGIVWRHIASLGLHMKRCPHSLKKEL